MLVSTMLFHTYPLGVNPPTPPPPKDSNAKFLTIMQNKYLVMDTKILKWQESDWKHAFQVKNVKFK